eukprot:765188-Hanusia_phi.AAC.1
MCVPYHTRFAALDLFPPSASFPSPPVLTSLLLLVLIVRFVLQPRCRRWGTKGSNRGQNVSNIAADLWLGLCFKTLLFKAYDIFLATKSLVLSTCVSCWTLPQVSSRQISQGVGVVTSL